jgi:DNA-binding IclR family transcriptional regulator
MESSVLVKAFLLLEALGREDDPVALASLSEQLELSKPTVHRLMVNLISLGYVERAGTGRYQLTDKLRSLGSAKSHRQLLSAAEPILLDLHSKTGETVNLGELRQDQIIYLRTMESPHPLRRVIKAGEKDQALSTALGRAIIANLPSDNQDLFFERATVTAQTTETIVDTVKLRKLIAQVNELGYATERDENELGVTCYGAPVFDGQDVVAAISMSVPTVRIDKSIEADLVEATKQAAAELSRAIA